MTDFGPERRSAWATARSRMLSRRSLLRSTGVAGAGLAGAALVGCGSSNKSATATPASTAALASPAASGTPGATGTAGATATATPQTGGTFNWLATNDPPTIDPYGNLSFLTKSTSAFVYSRLYQVAARPGANPWAVGVEPDLAESAESPDAQTWTVKLKQGVKFHDKPPVSGRELTSADVLFSWQRLSATASPDAALAKSAGWSKVEAIDDYTLKFTLDFPSADFLDDLADTNLLFVMPKEADGGFDPKTMMIGSGPWVFESYSPSQEFKFSKFRELPRARRALHGRRAPRDHPRVREPARPVPGGQPRRGGHQRERRAAAQAAAVAGPVERRAVRAALAQLLLIGAAGPERPVARRALPPGDLDGAGPRCAHSTSATTRRS